MPNLITGRETTTILGEGQRWGKVELDLHQLDQLRDLAASTADHMEHDWGAHRFGGQYDFGFTEGVAAVLYWLSGGQPDSQLRDLLDLED